MSARDERCDEASASSVTTIIVTYRRPELLVDVLDAVEQQTRPLGPTIVVDNDAQEKVREMLAAKHPRVRYIPAAENLGPGGGFALGLDVAERDAPADWYWLLDDDSPPAPTAVEQALGVAARLEPPVGAVGLRGGHVRRGRIVHDLRVGVVTGPERADFLLVDGSIISAEAIRRVGRPRTDFFIMMEDVEFSLRISEAGLPLFVRPDDGSSNLYQGSGAPWRGYYQARNHLRMAIERRSLPWVGGWLLRETGIFANHLWNCRWRSMRFRVCGTRDALFRRMGRTVEP